MFAIFLLHYYSYYYFHNRVDHVDANAFKMSGPIRCSTSSFSTIDRQSYYFVLCPCAVQTRI